MIIYEMESIIFFEFDWLFKIHWEFFIKAYRICKIELK